MRNEVLGILVGVTILTLLSAQLDASQPTDDLKAMQKEIEALKESQGNIQREFEAIKTFLLQRQAPQAQGRRAFQPFQPSVLSIAGEPFKGDRNAKVTIIDFSDYQ